MATIARAKTWITGDVLTASDLNGEFNVVFNDYNGSINSDNIGTLSDLTFSTASTTKSITINHTGTGDVLTIQDSGTDVIDIRDGGQIVGL